MHPLLLALLVAAPLEPGPPVEPGPDPGGAPAPAPEPAPAPTPPSAPIEPPAPAQDPCEAAEAQEPPEGWLDIAHAFLEHRFFDVTFAFDRFFADERDVECVRRSSFIRLRSEGTVDRDGTLRTALGVRADLRLPLLERRLRSLWISIERAGSDLLDPEPGPAAGETAPGRGAATVRWSFLETVRSSVDLGGGILLELPPAPVARLRFRHARELGPVGVGRLALVGSWDGNDGFGANGSLTLERPLAARLLARWSAATHVGERSNGFQSGSELALLAALGPSTALTLAGTAAIPSRPDLRVETWRALLRLRTSLWRSWILGEIEPWIAWPLDAAGGRTTVVALTARVELQLQERRPRQAGLTPASPSPSASGAGTPP